MVGKGAGAAQQSPESTLARGSQKGSMPSLPPTGHPPVWDPGAEEGHGVVWLLWRSLPCTPGPSEPCPG